MEIKLKKVTIKDLINNYSNDEEEGVVAYGGTLNVRPKYQREFIYNEKQQKAVINSVIKGFPLSVMYWVKNAAGGYEVLDGQQRTLSICEFMEGNFAIDWSGNKLFAHNLKRIAPEVYQSILDYELLVYICSGTKTEQLEWFKTINIAGEELTNQELLNANYAGEWLTDAKRYFSKTNCPASQIAKEYLSGSAIRQDYLETALAWISGDDGKNEAISTYMAQHCDDKTAMPLWDYFKEVMDWVKSVFPEYRKEMKGIEWGRLYNEYGEDFDEDNAEEFEEQIQELMLDDDVTKKKGIYEYLLTGDSKYLSIRKFPEGMIAKRYTQQKGICPICGEHFTREKMEADHITPWSEGGKTTLDNLQMLCKKCNREKSNK
jgi:hypothetical protein